MDEETKKLLEENLKLTKEIHVIAKKLNRHIIWQQVYGIIKILIIVVPIILGLIYLPSLLSGIFQQYSELLDLNRAKSKLNPDLLKNMAPEVNDK